MLLSPGYFQIYQNQSSKKPNNNKIKKIKHCPNKKLNTIQINNRNQTSKSWGLLVLIKKIVIFNEITNLKKTTIRKKTLHSYRLQIKKLMITLP